MTDDRHVRLDHEVWAPPELMALAERLELGRPVPSAAFRGALRRRLLAGRSQSRPARLRLSIIGYASAGWLLLLAGAMGAAGVGPLGA